MEDSSDHIKHVVLLMLENHSFDEMLGCFQKKMPDLNGINPNDPPRYNEDAYGEKYFQNIKTDYFMALDPKHELSNVQVQIADENSGFIKDFVSNYPTSSPQDRNNIMGYYDQGFLPALHALAKDFTICDNWFSSLPGPTWPNRFFALTGTASGYVKMPSGLDPHLDTIIHQTQPTIFDRLNEVKKSWKIFYYDFPNTLIFANQRKSENLKNYYKIDKFFDTDIREDESKFPDFVFIEPKYFGVDQNDDHPPHNIMKAEKLVADVYNAIRSNESLWKTTLLIIVFDEHGGFYDHVTPPKADPPDDKKMEYDFSQLGVRVPAILVSPWVERTVNHIQYDHTSVLKYLIDKWKLGSLGERTKLANSIGSAITRITPRDETDTVASIRVPFSKLIQSDGHSDLKSSDHQNAIHVLAGYIKWTISKEESPVLADMVALLTHPPSILQNTVTQIGKIFKWSGDWLMGFGIRAQEKKIRDTSSVAEQLINNKV